MVMVTLFYYKTHFLSVLIYFIIVDFLIKKEQLTLKRTKQKSSKFEQLQPNLYLLKVD